MCCAEKTATRPSSMTRFSASLVLCLLAGGLTSCGTPNDGPTLVELSTDEIHLEAIFGGASASQRLKAKAPGLGLELHGTEQAPWLGLGEAPDGLDFGGVVYDFWATDTTLPKSHYALDLRFDVYRQIDPAFERLVGSRHFRLTYDIRNAIGFQEELHAFRAVQAGAPQQPQITHVIGERGQWSLSASEPWLTASPASGTGVAEVAIGIDVANLPAASGSYSATLTAKGPGSREAATLAVSLLFAPPRFLLPQPSVTLTSDSGSTAQPQRVPVLDTGLVGIPFVVRASETWLTVGGDTTTGGTLSIGAAAGVAPGLHQATITLRTDETRLSGAFEAPPPATLNVALYVSEKPLASNVTTQLPPTARQLIADPLRPYVYVIVDDHSLEAYDIESGARVSSRAFSSRLGNAAISPDGEELYIAEPGLRKIHALVLPELTESNAFDVGTFEPELALLRCAGRNLLWTFSDQLEVLDLDAGTVVTPLEVPTLNSSGYPPRMIGASDGGTLFVAEGGSPPKFRAFDIACPTTAEPVGMWQRASAPIRLDFFSWPPQISADGHTICLSQTCLDTQALRPLSGLPPAATDALSNRQFSQLIFGSKGGIFVADSDGNVLQYDANWQPKGDLQVMPPTTLGIAPPQYQLGLTGDEHRILSLNDRGVLNVWATH